MTIYVHKYLTVLVDLS